MRKRGKKFAAARAAIPPDRNYSIEDAVPLVQKVKFAKFDETVEMSLRLGVDPKHADQMVRGTVVLPHGLGKSKRVLAIAGGEKQKEAQAAGADVVGGEEMVEKIQGGFMDFDAVVATPDMMRAVGKLGKVLGPRGLMPNPKTGTVTTDIAKAVQEIKAGKVEFRVDKTGIIHAPVGKSSFPATSLIANAHALVDSIVKAKPAAAKGKYLKSVTLSSTMGPGVRIDTATIDAGAKQGGRDRGVGGWGLAENEARRTRGAAASPNPQAPSPGEDQRWQSREQTSKPSCSSSSRRSRDPTARSSSTTKG